MKSSESARSVVPVVLFVAASLSSLSMAQAQGGGNGGGSGGGGTPPPSVGVGYRVHWIPVPAAATQTPNVNDIVVGTDAFDNPVALVVGWYLRNDRPGRQAFVYDHFGFIDPGQPQKFWDITELVATNPPSWAPGKFESSFTGVNSRGRVCGYVKSTDTDRIGIYFDLTGSATELQPLPSTSTSAIQYYGRSVTELGDVLITGTTSNSFAQSQVSTFNPSLPGIPAANLPMLLNGSDDSIHFNSVGSAIVVLGQTTNGIFVRHTVGTGTESFAGLNYPRGINEWGEFSCTRSVQVKRNSWKFYATRIGANGSVEWQLDRSTLDNIQGSGVGGALTQDINNSGDVIRPLSNVGGYYFHEGDPNLSGDEMFISKIEDLLITSSDPSGAVRNSGWYFMLSDRDETDFGWLVGNTTASSGTTGVFLLIPEILP